MVLPKRLLDALERGVLSEAQARAICARGQEAVVFALLLLTEQLAEQPAKPAAESHQTPATSSDMKPPYQKPPAKSRKKPPGAKPGHAGWRRKLPQRIDHRQEHRARRCPNCGVISTTCSRSWTNPALLSTTTRRNWRSGRR